LRGERPVVQFHVEELEDLSVGARGVAAAAVRVEKRAAAAPLFCARRVRSTRSRASSISVNAPDRAARRREPDRAPASGSPPVDAPVFGAAAAEVVPRVRSCARRTALPSMSFGRLRLRTRSAAPVTLLKTSTAKLVGRMATAS